MDKVNFPNSGWNLPTSKQWDDMLDNIGNILSTNNVANTMTSNGRIRIALKYIEGLIESFFFYRANRYDIKGKQYLKKCE